MNAKIEDLTIQGMSCGHCVKAVEGALAEVAGIDTAEVSIGHAQVSYDPSQTNRTDLVAAIEEEGYTVV